MIKAEYKQVLLIISLSGAGIYLSAMAYMMVIALMFGSATLIPDYGLTHGEPILVLMLAASCFYVSFSWYRLLLKPHFPTTSAS